MTNGKNFYASLYSAALLLMAVPASLCITSCSDAITDNASDDDEVLFNVTFGDSPTRAVSSPVDGLNSFYIYAYQETTRKANNVQYVYNGTTWKAKGIGMTWPKTDAVNIYGLTDSYRTIFRDDMTASRSFDYYIPPKGSHDVWFASALNQTKAKTGGAVNLKFARLVSRINLSCKNSMTNMSVKISEIVIHNIVSAGNFKFNEKSATAGTWTLLNTGETPYYANYPQEFKTKLEDGVVRADVLPMVPPKTNSQMVTDSAYILIPQKTVKWTPDKALNQDTTYAAVNHQCYLEVKCQIFETAADGTLGDCVWGDPTKEKYDEYESIFIPLLKTWSRSNNASNIIFDLADAYNADGSKWEPHEGSEEIRFDESMLLEPIVDDGNVDAWDEDDEDLGFDVTL